MIVGVASCRFGENNERIILVLLHRFLNRPPQNPTLMSYLTLAFHKQLKVMRTSFVFLMD